LILLRRTPGFVTLSQSYPNRGVTLKLQRGLTSVTSSERVSPRGGDERQDTTVLMNTGEIYSPYPDDNRAGATFKRGR